MTRRHTPLQQYKEAQQIARDHGMFIAEKAGAYLLYRNTTPRATLVGKRGSPEGIRALALRAATAH